MCIQETVDKFEDSNSRFIPRYNTQKRFEHLTQSLNQQLRLIVNQQPQRISLNTSHNNLTIKLTLRNQSRYQINQRPQYLRIISNLKHSYRNRKDPIKNISTINSSSSKQNNTI